MKSWIWTHFDVIAAAWLIVLVFAWSILMASSAGSKPSNWDGPLIGGVDWNSTLTQQAPAGGGQGSMVGTASTQR